MRHAIIAALAFAFAGPATAQTADEAAIRDVLARWYDCHAKEKAGCRYWAFMAPGAINGGPGIRAHDDGMSAVIRGPWINHELAARALTFAYDVDDLRIEGGLARARVWERGYFYAFAAQSTYENGASALFVLEKQPDGRWLILAHEATSQGIPPGKQTDPLPDLRDKYYQENPDRDAAKDAADATTF